MGYNTDWNGSLKLSRDLKQQELNEWKAIVENRHDSKYHYGDEEREFPSIWCDFDIVGREFRWNGSEKTYEGKQWIKFFLKKLLDWSKASDHLIYAEGDMEWNGEEEDDRGRVIVEYLPFDVGYRMHIENVVFDYEREATLHI